MKIDERFSSIRDPNDESREREFEGPSYVSRNRSNKNTSYHALDFLRDREERAEKKWVSQRRGNISSCSRGYYRFLHRTWNHG